MKEKVDQIARKVGIPEDKVSTLKVFQSSNTFGSSGGSLYFNTHWIALPRTSFARDATELASMSPTGNIVVEGQTYPLKPASDIHPALLKALLYSDKRRDFVTAHELGHLREHHLESEAAGTALAVLPVLISYKLSVPLAAFLVGGVTLAYGVNEARSRLARRRELEADGIAVKAGCGAGGKEHFENSRDFELFGLQRARSPLIHQPELWGQDYSHPSFSVRLKHLDELMKRSGDETKTNRSETPTKKI